MCEILQAEQQKTEALNTRLGEVSGALAVSHEQAKLLREMEALHAAKAAADKQPVSEAHLGTLRLHHMLTEAQVAVQAAQSVALDAQQRAIESERRLRDEEVAREQLLASHAQALERGRLLQQHMAGDSAHASGMAADEAAATKRYANNADKQDT